MLPSHELHLAVPRGDGRARAAQHGRRAHLRELSLAADLGGWPHGRHARRCSAERPRRRVEEAFELLDGGAGGDGQEAMEERDVEVLERAHLAQRGPAGERERRRRQLRRSGDARQEGKAGGGVLRRGGQAGAAQLPAGRGSERRKPLRAELARGLAHATPELFGLPDILDHECRAVHVAPEDHLCADPGREGAGGGQALWTWPRVGQRCVWVAAQAMAASADQSHAWHKHGMPR